jgi:nucleotide-binding universal stress UspA family protein
MVQTPFVESVFHPSDFSDASANAFAHALAVALHRRSRFTMLHVAANNRAAGGWTDFPAVRETLERWGVLEPGSPRSAVLETLGLRVKKVSIRSDDVLRAVRDYLAERPTDLIVLTTEGRDGLPRWMQGSVAERLARGSKTKTLFVPRGAPGFVSLESGEVTLRRILVPFDHTPNPVAALTYAARAASLVAPQPVEIKLLHVGEPGAGPAIDPPETEGCTWETLHRSGDVVEAVVSTTDEQGADLIVMATEGHDGILDALRGSVTEQVLRRTRCPLLAVPAAAGPV